MATADEDGSGWWRWQTTTTRKIGLRWRRTREGGERWRRQQSGDDGCGGGTWRRQTTMAVVGDNSNGGRQQWRTTKVADNDGTRGQAAGYEEEGGGWAANNNGIRSAGQRAWNKIKKSSLRKPTFFQWYGLSGWSFCSHQKQTPFLLDLSVIHTL